MKEKFTDIWKALADPSRRAILDLLRERPRTTGELCTHFDQVSRFAVMKHLTILEDAGLLAVKREGRERWNSLNVVPLQHMYERWLKPYEAQWASSLLHIKRYVETTTEREAPMSEQVLATPIAKTMHIEMEISLNAAIERVFSTLTSPIIGWWDTTNCTFNHGQMHLEAEIGKRFYEAWDEGDALFGIVTLLEQNKTLEIEGPMGMDRPIQSLIRYELSAQGQITLLKFTHYASGQFSDKTELSYVNGWKDMLENRLPAYLAQQ